MANLEWRMSICNTCDYWCGYPAWEKPSRCQICKVTMVDYNAEWQKNWDAQSAEQFKEWKKNWEDRLSKWTRE